MLTNIYKIMSKLLIYKLFVVFFAVTVNGQVSIYSYEDVDINQITSNVVEIDAEFFRISDLLFVNNKVLVIDKSNEPTVQIFKVVNDTLPFAKNDHLDQKEEDLRNLLIHGKSLEVKNTMNCIFLMRLIDEWPF